MKLILKSFSYIFHPLFVSVYTIIYFFFIYRNIFSVYSIYYFVFLIALLTVLLPVLLFYILTYLKLLNTDIMVNNVKQRRLPLAIQSIYFYFISFYALKPIQSFEIRYFFIGAMISTILALLAALLNKKISLHMVGISGMVTFIIGMNIKSGHPSLPLFCLLIIIIGCVASSRLLMKAHTLSELFWGTLIGIFCQIQLFPIWL